MNRKMICRILGNILIFEAIILLLPFLVSIIYKENDTAIYFVITSMISLAIGYILANLKTDNKHIYAKEGFIVVSGLASGCDTYGHREAV